jgi:hypothetical protein
MTRLLLLLALLSACARTDTPGGISDEQFVTTLVELRRAATGAARDPVSFAAARQRILTEQNVTEEQLRAYIQSHSRDLTHLAAVWESVNERASAEDIH